MTNIKRVLSLALAAVMLMGMMVIGAGAKDAADFGDYNEVQYNEAMDVMVGLKIIDGDDKGQLNPTGNLTREQAAKIICYLLMGKEGADLLPAETAPFADVAATRWSAGYIAYCKSEGIISGIGNNKFNPTGNVTAAEFAKMLLGALGYESKNEGFTGTQWSINVTKTAQKAGLFEGDSSVAANLALTREEACLYSLNTLTANMVEYTGGVDVSTGDTTVTVGATRYETGSTFAEEYFKDLKKVTAGVFTTEGLPGYKWQYNNKDISAAYTDAVLIDTLDTEVATITKGEMYSNYTFDGTTDGSSIAVYVNGTREAGDDMAVSAIAERGKKDKALSAYNGAEIKLYDRNEDGSVDTAVVTIAYLAEVTKVTPATAADDRKIDLKVYDVRNDALTVTGVYTDDFAKGDFIMVVPSANTSDGFKEPTSMTAATAVIDAKVTSYKDDAVTFNGTTYSYSTFRNTQAKANASGTDTYNFNSSYDFYLDAYGNVVAAFTHTVGASTNYAYIVDVNGTLTTTIDGTTPAVEARVVLGDGSVALYQIALEKITAEGATKGDYIIKGTSITVYDVDAVVTQTSTTVTTAAGALKGNVYGYTLSDGTLTLEALTAASGSMTKDSVYGDTVNNVYRGVTSVSGTSNTVLLNSSTVYVLYNSKDKTASVYVGNANLPNGYTKDADIDGAKVVLTASAANRGTASVLFATTTAGAAATNEYVYIDASAYSTSWDGSKTVFAYEGIAADGSKVNVTASATLTYDGLYTYDEDMVLNTTALVSTDSAQETAQNTYYIYDTKMTLDSDLLGIGSTYYNVTADTQIVYIDNSLTEVNDNGGFVVLAENNGGASNNVATIYVTAD